MSRKYYIPTDTPRRMSLSFPKLEPLSKAYIDLQLSLNGYYIATTVVLAALLRGGVHVRERIISELRGIFPPKPPGFREYLLVAIMNEIDKDIDAQITDEFIFSQVVPYYSEIWYTKPDRRSVRGDMANTAQALDLVPISGQINKAVQVIKETVEWKKKDGLEERLYKSLINSQIDGK